MTSIRWLCLVSAAVTALVSGCGLPSGHPARPGPHLNGVNPCQLITASQADSRALYVISGYPKSDWPGVTDCSWSSDELSKDINVFVRADVTRGVAGMNSPVPVQTIRVGGFRVLQGAAPMGDGSTDCVHYVDVAPGQSLLVSYDDYDTASPPHHDRACAITTTLTTTILTNLQALQH